MSQRIIPPVLIVDDEENLRKIIAFQLSQDGIETVESENAEEAIAKLREHPFSCVISDVRMPGADGLSVLDFVRQACPGTPAIILTAYGTVDMAVKALKNGAFDFLTKPFDQQDLIRTVRAAQSTYRLDNPLHNPQTSVSAIVERHWVGASAHFQEVSKWIEHASHSPCNLMILGEMGTGKELVARAIHAASALHDRPFIRIHCAAAPADVLEGELFGYEKGAHPTLISGKPGKIELADQGTLLLEEVQCLPQPLQLRLLEFLQTKRVERVGSNFQRTADVRVIATTRKVSGIEEDLREDLYLALNVMCVELLPLREHMDDLPPIARHLVKALGAKLDKPVKDIDSETLRTFARYSWPGNVRELENILERMIVTCHGFSLTDADLPLDFRRRLEEGPLAARGAETPAEGGLKALVKNATIHLEKSLIIDTLRSTNGNITHAARRLEISRKSLQNKMKEFSIREIFQTGNTQD
jgi:DNA-binding NtrC family response regulator